MAAMWHRAEIGTVFFLEKTARTKTATMIANRSIDQRDQLFPPSRAHLIKYGTGRDGTGAGVRLLVCRSTELLARSCRSLAPPRPASPPSTVRAFGRNRTTPTVPHHLSFLSDSPDLVRRPLTIPTYLPPPIRAGPWALLRLGTPPGKEWRRPGATAVASRTLRATRGGGLCGTTR